MSPDDFRRFLQEDLNHGRPDTDSDIVWGFAMADLWEAAIKTCGERFKAFPCTGEREMVAALKRLENL